MGYWAGRFGLGVGVRVRVRATVPDLLSALAFPFVRMVIVVTLVF